MQAVQEVKGEGEQIQENSAPEACRKKNIHQSGHLINQTKNVADKVYQLSVISYQLFIISFQFSHIMYCQVSHSPVKSSQVTQAG